MHLLICHEYLPYHFHPLFLGLKIEIIHVNLDFLSIVYNPQTVCELNGPQFLMNPYTYSPVEIKGVKPLKLLTCKHSSTNLISSNR